MKKILIPLLLALFFTTEIFAWNSGGRVKVQYQIKSRSSNSWTTNNATLNGAKTESMMRNQIASRHPGCQVRILAATSGTNVRVFVQYQVKSGQSSWTTNNATLLNAMTKSMARNQLLARHPGRQIRVLSMTEK